MQLPTGKRIVPIRTAAAIAALMAAAALANSQFAGALKHLKPPEPISEAGCEVKVCEDVRLISCQPELDGPVSFWDMKHELLLSRCAFFSGCTGDIEGVRETWEACEASGRVKVVQAARK